MERKVFLYYSFSGWRGMVTWKIKFGSKKNRFFLLIITVVVQKAYEILHGLLRTSRITHISGLN